jgi:hypothetical protein
MRSVQLLMLALLATAANADTLSFSITFNAVTTVDTLTGTPAPQQFFFGSLVTDGKCKVCSIEVSEGVVDTDGINRVQMQAFFLNGPEPIFSDGNFTFDVATDTLTGVILDNLTPEFITIGEPVTTCPPSGPCPSGPGTYFFGGSGNVDEWGTFTVAPVPEPSSILLLAACALLVCRGLTLKRRLP